MRKQHNARQKCTGTKNVHEFSGTNIFTEALVEWEDVNYDGSTLHILRDIGTL